MSLSDRMSFTYSLAVLAREEIERNHDLIVHPTAERLAAYHAGELSEGEDREIQQHLIACTECPALLLDLEDLFEPRHRDLDVTDSGVDRAWQDLRARLEPNGGSNRPGSRLSIWRTVSDWLTAVPRPVYAAATALMLMVAVWSLGTGPLSREEVQPDIDPVVVELGITSRGLADAKLLEFTPTRKSFSLRWDLSPEPRFKKFLARFIDEAGKEIPVHGLKRGRGKDESVQMILYRDWLKPGLYEVQLIGLASGQGKDEQLASDEILIVER